MIQSLIDILIEFNRYDEISEKLKYLKKRKYGYHKFWKYKKVLLELRPLLPEGEWDVLYDSHLLWVQGCGSEKYKSICIELYNKYRLF